MTAIHPVWLATRGLKGVSPNFAEVFEIAPINRWFFGMVLAILLVTAAARRMIPAAKISASGTRWNWRRRPTTYFHEYRFVALLVAVTIFCLAGRLLMETSRARSVFSPTRTSMQFALDALDYCAADPRCQLWAIAFCMAFYRSIYGVARTSEGLCAAPPELPLSLFAIVWTGLLATVVMAVPIFAALGFSRSLPELVAIAILTMSAGQ